MFRMITRTALVGVAVLAAAACSKEPTDDMGSASAVQAGSSMPDATDYTVVFKSTWTKANHPFEYPTANAVSGPHFSGVIGASHDASFSLFREGSLPTPGIEKLSEEGKHSPLDDEIKAAMAVGSVGALFTTGPLRDFGDSIVTMVRVDGAHPLVSLVAMIAPSPDWFVGAASVHLLEGGAWVESRTLELYAYDSGGDDGATYKAADKDANPKKATTQARSRHFINSGAPIPVATVTLTRRSEM